MTISFTQFPPNDPKRRASSAKGGEPYDYWAERIQQPDNALARAKAAKTEAAQDVR